MKRLIEKTFGLIGLIMLLNLRMYRFIRLLLLISRLLMSVEESGDYQSEAALPSRILSLRFINNKPE